MNDKTHKHPEWVTRGKSIRQLITELQTFENQELEVMLSTDDGDTFQCISLVGKFHDDDTPICGLVNSE